MKALKSHPQIERPRRINSQITLARYTAGLVLALAGLLGAATLAFQPAMVASAQAEAQSWTFTGSINTPRILPTATLLQNGKVLVAGGFGWGFAGEYGNPFNAAELYDLETGAWSFTGNLNTPRGGHTATLLRDGKVLVVGGYFGSGPDDFLNSAELYDPQTGTWSLTGSLHAPPYSHTATLLQNGKVLVAGVFRGANPLSVSAAELYDPETGTWSVTGDPNTGLYPDTATLLQNGKVLVMGHNSAELYDPGTGTWSSVGRLDRSIRVRYTATLLPDGTVLIAGGRDEELFGTVTYDTVELYNPNTGTWSSTGYLNIPRSHHTATLLPDGKVLIVGGSTRIGNRISTPVSSELYDPSTGKWSFTSNPNTPRSSHTATLLADGKVLIVGGEDLGSSAELGSNFAAVPPTIVRPVISMASGARKKLFVVGENFASGAVILINGLEQKTRNDSENPVTRLIGKKAGKKKNLKPGDRIQVRNPSGTTSQGFIFTGS